MFQKNYLFKGKTYNSLKITFYIIIELIIIIENLIPYYLSKYLISFTIQPTKSKFFDVITKGKTYISPKITFYRPHFRQRRNKVHRRLIRLPVILWLACLRIVNPTAICQI